MSKRDKSPERENKTEKKTKNERQQVYVVFKGEAYEGGSVLRVFGTKEKAEVWVKKYIAQYPETPRHTWKRESEDGGWRCGHDYIEIEPWEVK